MDVKKKILLLLFSLGNVLIILSIFFKKSTLGQIWYIINSNSLIGLQKIIETNFNTFYKTFFIFLNYNIFIVSGLIFIIIVAFISDF